jgi:uncharacterized membrane protein
MVVVEALVEFLAGLPAWLVVLLISMLPIVELRLAIPVGIGYYHMAWWYVYVVAVIGNLIPVPLILKFFAYAERFLRRWRRWARFFDKLFARTRKRAAKHILRYQELGLILFVAIPLPVTGAWTGSLIAYLFALRQRGRR